MSSSDRAPLTCCRGFPGVVRRVRSPFARLIATGYCDGPTQGLIECGACRTVYAFEMLDCDDGQDVRVFSLASVAGTLEELAERAAPLPPGWPVWVLVGQAAMAFGAHLEQVRQSATVGEFVVATSDLLGELLVWAPLGQGTSGNWFVELGLRRS